MDKFKVLRVSLITWEKVMKKKKELEFSSIDSLILFLLGDRKKDIDTVLPHFSASSLLVSIICATLKPKLKMVVQNSCDAKNSLGLTP